MIDSIDVHDIPEESVRFVQSLVETLREKTARHKREINDVEEKALEKSILLPYQSDVIRRFSRKDVYDDEYFSHRVPGY